MNSMSSAPTVTPMVEPVSTDGLADSGCDERARDPEKGRQHEALRASGLSGKKRAMRPATKPLTMIQTVLMPCQDMSQSAYCRSEVFGAIHQYLGSGRPVPIRLRPVVH